jgi:hypothetical protein
MPVKEVPIKKKGGGERKLGVPTLLDRIAQQGKVRKEISKELWFSGVHHSPTMGYSKGETDAFAQYVHEPKIEKQRDGKVQGTEHPQTAETVGSNSRWTSPYHTGYHQLLL